MTKRRVVITGMGVVTPCGIGRKILGFYAKWKKRGFSH